MRVFSFLFCFVLLALSCDKEVPNDEGTSVPECEAVIISNSIFQGLASNQATLIELSIEDDCLTVMLGISGCDADHTLNMISDGGIAESLPVQITFDFQDENPQDCEAYFVVERQFDISPIRDLIKDDIIIRFRNSNSSILYIK